MLQQKNSTFFAKIRRNFNIITENTIHIFIQEFCNLLNCLISLTIKN